ncbi:MAG: hypothetical protein ACRDG4_13385, partial [Chloroflexota bacterium]
MSGEEITNPVPRQIDLLLTGYGYNFYNVKNQMRADDLLVRQKVAETLGLAANALGALQGDYQRRYV